MTETDFMKEVMLEATAQGCVIFRTNVGKVKLADGRWFDTGLPKGHADLYGVRSDGTVFYIETKLKPRKATLEQCRFLARMAKQGACVGIAYTIAEALRIIRWNDSDKQYHLNRIEKELNGK